MSALDPTTEAGARELADRIVRHWRELGFAVKAWPVRQQVKAGLPIVWGVETDMVNGLPRQQRADVGEAIVGVNVAPSKALPRIVEDHSRR